MQIILLVVCVLLGWGSILGLGRMWTAARDRIPADHRRRSYDIAKNFPAIVFSTVFALVFFAAVGATVIYYVAVPQVASGLRDATSWGPELAGGIVILLIYGFWCSPDAPSETPPRGRSLKRPAHKLASRLKSIPQVKVIQRPKVVSRLKPNLVLKPISRLKPLSRLKPTSHRGRTIRTYRNE